MIIFAIIIFNSNDTMQLPTQKVHWGYKFTKSQEKINHFIYIDYIKQSAKKEQFDRKKKKNIQQRYRNGYLAKKNVSYY